MNIPPPAKKQKQKTITARSHWSARAKLLWKISSFKTQPRNTNKPLVSAFLLIPLCKQVRPCNRGRRFKAQDTKRRCITVCAVLSSRPVPKDPLKEYRIHRAGGNSRNSLWNPLSHKEIQYWIWLTRDRVGWGDQHKRKSKTKRDPGWRETPFTRESRGGKEPGTKFYGVGEG